MAKRRPSTMTEYQIDGMSKRKNLGGENSPDDGQNLLGQNGQNDGQFDRRSYRQFWITDNLGGILGEHPTKSTKSNIKMEYYNSSIKNWRTKIW